MSSTLTINNNLASLGAQRRLATSTASLQQSFERLSSGLRINRASDDAAGLAIASSLKVDSRVYSQAVRNVNDAASYYAVAEGAMTSLINITTRLKELAEQSANGVLSGTQRKSLNAEAQALGQEYRRITWATEFNGGSLFDGRSGLLSVQAGYGAVALSGGVTGNATYQARQAISGASFVGAVATGDLNGDGRADIVTGEYGSVVNVFLSNGDGSFRARTAFTGTGSPRDIRLADYNNDGILDAAISATGSGFIHVLVGNGDGSFRAQANYTTGTNTTITTADLNADGNLDIIAANANVGVTGSVDVFLGNGNGSFKARITYAHGATPQSIRAADVNNDGKMDLVTSNDTTGASVYLGNGDGSFLDRRNYATVIGGVDAELGDFNGDGNLDIISGEGFLIASLLGNGDGSFRAATTYSGSSAVFYLRAEDLNADGRLDVIGVDINTSTVSVYSGNGDGSFKARVSYNTGLNPRMVATADFNGDGVLDLVSGDTNASTISILIGNGDQQAVVAPTLGFYSLTTQETSKAALTQFSGVLSNLSAAIGAIGANESRLRTTSAVLQTSRFSFESAASQIIDVDVANETARLTRGQILQQAGASILAQANQQPALALRLLQG